MCYTGKGRFETSMGECTVSCGRYKEFEEKMGVKACIVCTGYLFDVEECRSKEELYSDKELEEISKKAREINLVW